LAAVVVEGDSGTGNQVFSAGDTSTCSSAASAETRTNGDGDTRCLAVEHLPFAGMHVRVHPDDG
jgi:hypothetical protein